MGSSLVIVRTLAHIINPVKVGAESDLFRAQPITFQTMLRARESAGRSLDVRLLTAQFPEDRSMVPVGFQPTDDLERSVLDFGIFAKPRRLPILADILDRCHAAAEDAEYMVYTNADIAVMPYFYLAVARMIDQGYDAFVINRRTIQDNLSAPGDLPLMYAAVGNRHPGHDCFVFRRDAYPTFELGHACIGALWIGRLLLANMAAVANRYEEFMDTHLTFHLGDDRAWSRPENDEFSAHNRRELIGAWQRLCKMHGPMDEYHRLPASLLDVFRTRSLREKICGATSRVVIGCLRPLLGPRARLFLRKLSEDSNP